MQQYIKVSQSWYLLHFLAVNFFEFQEAVHREQMIETKLQALQALISSTQEASQTSWQALIDEDRLLSRIDMLENQLAVYSKVSVLGDWKRVQNHRSVSFQNIGEDKLREQLHELHDERLKYENSAKVRPLFEGDRLSAPQVLAVFRKPCGALYKRKWKLSNV